MAIKLPDGTYKCSICGESYSQASKADNCRDTHELLYIPINKEELNLLIHAIIMGDTSMVPPSLLQTLQKYARLQVIREARDENFS